MAREDNDDTSHWASVDDNELHLELIRQFGSAAEAELYSNDVDPSVLSEPANGEEDSTAALGEILGWDDEQLLAHLQTTAENDGDIPNPLELEVQCGQECINLTEREEKSQQHIRHYLAELERKTSAQEPNGRVFIPGLEEIEIGMDDLDESLQTSKLKTELRRSREERKHRVTKRLRSIDREPQEVEECEPERDDVEIDLDLMTPRPEDDDDAEAVAISDIGGLSDCDVEASPMTPPAVELIVEAGEEQLAVDSSIKGASRGPADAPKVGKPESIEDELEFDQELELTDDEDEEGAAQVKQPGDPRMAAQDFDASEAKHYEAQHLDIDDTLELELDLDDDEDMGSTAEKVADDVGLVDGRRSGPVDEDAVVLATEEDLVEEFEVDGMDAYDAGQSDDTQRQDDDQISLASNDLLVESGMDPSPRASTSRHQRTYRKQRPRKRHRSPSGSKSPSPSALPESTKKDGTPKHKRRKMLPAGDADELAESPKSHLRRVLRMACCKSDYGGVVYELHSAMSLSLPKPTPRAKLSFALKAGSLRPDVKDLSDAGFQAADADDRPKEVEEIKRAVPRSQPLELLRKYVIDGDIPSFLQGNVIFFREGIMFPGKTLLPLTDGDCKTCVTLSQMWLLATLGDQYKARESQLFQEYGIKRLNPDAVSTLLAYLSGATEHCPYASTPVLAVTPVAVPISQKQRRLQENRLQDSRLQEQPQEEPWTEMPPHEVCSKKAAPFSKAVSGMASQAPMKPPPAPRWQRSGTPPAPYSKSKGLSKAPHLQAERHENFMKFAQALHLETRTIVELAQLKFEIEILKNRKLACARGVT